MSLGSISGGMLGTFFMEVEGMGSDFLNFPDEPVAKARAPAKLALRGLFLSDSGVKTKVGDNWCQKHLANPQLYPFWKKSTSIWLRPSA